METFKPVKTIVTVDKIIYATNPVGKLYPMLKFVPNKETKKIDIDAIRYNGVSELIRAHLGKGARLKIEFDADRTPNIKQVLKRSNVDDIPRACVTCNRRYIISEGEFYCPNFHCAATARGFLYILIRIASPLTTVEEITMYLDKYVSGDSTGSLDSVSEFVHVFSNIKDKNTQARENNWKKWHPELGEKIFELDNKVQEFMDYKQYPKNWFWNICNFPKMVPSIMAELSTIDPQGLVDGKDRTYLKLDKLTRKYIENNMDFIHFLLGFFNKYGEKKWIN